MIKSAAGKPSVRMAAPFAYATGATGILANLFLIALYVLLGLQAARPEAQVGVVRGTVQPTRVSLWLRPEDTGGKR